ncbi:MAG: hypothetical protein PHW04_07595 [Candidatus Wallbacteria bacterium]|nr:hypothetical protein [Candidatus Wallbacteria bacterium]
MSKGLFASLQKLDESIQLIEADNLSKKKEISDLEERILSLNHTGARHKPIAENLRTTLENLEFMVEIKRERVKCLKKIINGWGEKIAGLDESLRKDHISEKP